MFSLAVEWGWRTDNPTNIPRYDEHGRERYLSADEFQRFLDALDAYADQSAADALRLLIFTGARPAEALSADWTQFDLDRGVWTKPSHQTKQKKTEHVPLNDSASGLLRKMAKDGTEGYIFPGISRVAPRSAWRRALTVVGEVAKRYHGQFSENPRDIPLSCRAHDLSPLVS